VLVHGINQVKVGKITPPGLAPPTDEGGPADSPRAAQSLVVADVFRAESAGS
jgi:hypothetical protein